MRECRSSSVVPGVCGRSQTCCREDLGLQDKAHETQWPQHCLCSGWGSPAKPRQAGEGTGQNVLETVPAVMAYWKVLAIWTSLMRPRKTTCECCQGMCCESGGQVSRLGPSSLDGPGCYASPPGAPQGISPGTWWDRNSLPGNMPVLVPVGKNEATQAGTEGADIHLRGKSLQLLPSPGDPLL